MSVSSLPEWKQLLLEKKRREEEERERREKEEEKKFASMPAWKRGIIQRRKAKQDSLGDREKERDMCLLQVDVRSASDGLSDSDSFVTVNLGSETSLSPDAGLWLEGDLKASQVSLETIVPVHENPFIRTQSAWRKGRDAEGGNEVDVKEKEKDKLSPRGQDGESGRGRDIELKIERFRDVSEGRERERSRENSNQWKDRELLRVRKDEEEKETDPGSFSPHVPCLRTIRADNIIIIEQERKTSDERRSRWKETERERPEEDHRGMKMDLREILAGGGSITEIRASEVLIIKPSAAPEERSPEGGRGGKGSGRDDGEMKCSVDERRESLGRELRTDMSWLRDKEKERPWGQATVIKDDRKDSLDDNVFVDRGGRVSQLVSKFGQHPKPPSRSKSSDNFLRPGRKKCSGDEDDEQSEEDWRNLLLKGVPKRSFSFSDRVICSKENGLDDNGYHERKTRERVHSDRSVAPCSLEKETTAKIKLDKDWFGKHRDGHLQKKDEKGAQKRNDAEMCMLKKAEPIDLRAAERTCDTDGDEGFTVASVKNTEGISFARRVAIKQDGKTRTERDAKKSLERETNAERDSGGQVEAQVCDKKVSEEGFKSTVTPGSSAFTECSGLLCAVSDRVRDPHRGPEWSGHSVLSQHTEELISKIEKIGDTTVYSNEKGERAYKTVHDMTKGSDQDEVTPRSPKRTVPMGIPPGPLEIQIPRSVFYVAEEMAERKRAVGHTDEDWEGGKGVERRDSWRIGKPLSRVESLREKIRQRELERLRQTQGGGGGEGAEINNIQTAEGRPDERGSEVENEWEAAALTRKRLLEAERGQEDAAAQASEAAFDVTQEVSVLKSCSQIPVSAPHSQAEEVTGGYATVASEVIYDQISDDEDDPLKHVEEELRRHRAQHHNTEEERGEEEELSEEEIEGNTSPLEPASPPHPNTAAMSRIYNLESVGSRSGLCLRERTVDIPSVHLVKVRPLMSNAQQGDSKTLSGEDISGVQTVQRQIEQFQLKEHSPNTFRKDRETGQQSPRGALRHQVKGDVKMTEKDQEASPLRVHSPTFQSNQTAAVTPSLLRSQSPDNTLKPSDCAPTPAPSPSSPSPTQSPSISPSPTPSPTLFSIRSASGGQVKRGTTFTITPKKPTGGGGAGVTGSKPPKTSSQQAQTTSAVAQPAKKKYPTVEEIEVIGGYQNLEKSCLVKNRGMPKRGKVCFDEDQLEQVCEYPSETSMLVCTPYPQDLWRQQGEEVQEEEAEVEVSMSTRNAVGGGLRVGQCHPLLKRHNV